jgi:hypothetical protein
MNRSILWISMTILSISAQAQKHSPNDLLQHKTDQVDTIHAVLKLYVDSLLDIYQRKVYTSGEQLMTREYFGKFMNKYFSYVTTTKAGLPDGNSVSLQPTSNSTVIQANLSHKTTNTIYNFGLQANYSNNIANLFSGSDVTGNTTFYTNISFLQAGSRKVRYDANLSVNSNDAKIIKVNQFMADLDAKYKVSYAADSLIYDKSLHVWDSVDALQKMHPVDSNGTKLIALRQVAIAAAIKLKSYGLNERRALYTVNGILDDVTQQLKDSLKTVLDTMEINNNAWQYFRFGWFSTGLTYTQQQYKTYDSGLAFSNRVNDLTFNNAGLTLSYNYIFQRSAQYAKMNPASRMQSWYFSVAYTLANDLNYAHLDTVDLLTIHQVPGTDSVYQFQSDAKVRDISGQTKRFSWNHTLAVQSTLALTNSNFMGLTTALNTTISPYASPVYNGTLGLLFRFINTDNQQSKLNFQLFLQLNDWGDSQGKGTSTWQRKVIGFNASIPFSNLFF